MKINENRKFVPTFNQFLNESELNEEENSPQIKALQLKMHKLDMKLEDLLKRADVYEDEEIYDLRSELEDEDDPDERAILRDQINKNEEYYDKKFAIKIEALEEEIDKIKEKS